MVGYQGHLDALKNLGASVLAASVDPEDKAREVAADVSFPIAHGVVREQADAIGAWWEPRRGIVQPSEFVVGEDGKVLLSTYSSGPVGRMAAEDLVKLLELFEKRRTEG